MIGIVITLYNSERFIGECIRSVKEQSCERWKAIIVDDGSTDGSARIVSESIRDDPRFCYLLKANGGVANARNTGYEALGDVDAVLFLDHDDLLERDALTTLSQTLDANPGCVAAAGWRTVIDENGNGVDQNEPDAIRGGRFRLRGHGWEFVSGSGEMGLETVAMGCWALTTPGQSLIRGTAIPAALPFDQSVAPSDDWDFWVRLCLDGPIVFTDQPVVRWRKHSANNSNNTSRMVDAGIRCRRKWCALAKTGDWPKSVVRTLHRAQVMSGVVRLSWAGRHFRNLRFLDAGREVVRCAKDLVSCIAMWR